MNASQSLPVVLAITGASGAIYAVRLLQILRSSGISVHLVVSPSGRAVLRQELDPRFDADGLTAEGLLGLLLSYRPAGQFGISDERWLATEVVMRDTSMASSVRVWEYGDYFSPIASGSALTAGMVICPCSGATMSGVSHAAGNNLIQRAADVHLKERRPLIVVPRETPLSSLQLQNMLQVSQAGGTVMPAMPGFYHGPVDTLDLVDFLVARVLDHLKIEHNLMRRWG